MSNELLKALNGAQGELDAWLEVRHELQVREAILSLVGKDSERKLFAAMAMQGMCANPSMDGTWQEIALASVKCADALLAELAKGEPK